MRLVRRKKRVYAFRTVRMGDRFTSRYVGSGLVAELAHETHQFAGELLDAARRARSATMETLKQADEQIDCVLTAVDAIVHGQYTNAGFHKYRNQWKRNTHDRGN